MRAPVPAIAAVALAATLLIACGGSDAAPPAPSQPQATAADSAPVATARATVAATEAPVATTRATAAAVAETPAAEAVAALPRIYFIHTEW